MRDAATSSSTSRRGVALITSLAVVVVVATLILGSIITTRVELAVARNDNTATQAQYAAQAGLQTYKAALFQTFRWLQGGSSGGTILDACESSLGGSIDFLRGGDGTTFEWENNRIVIPQGTVNDAFGSPIGTFDVTLIRDPSNENRITVRSVGRTIAARADGQATATASATFLIRNSSVLEQAIFAGAGSGMAFINGNSTVYGGIYVVGDPDYTDEDDLRNNQKTWLLSSNGGFNVRNSYDFRGQGHEQFIVDEALLRDNLCAAFRVQHGRVELGGNTTFGTEASPLLTVAVGRGLGTRTPRGQNSYDRDILMSGNASVYACGLVEGEEELCADGRVSAFDIDPMSAPVFPVMDESPNTEFCEDLWRDCIRDEAVANGLSIRATDTGIEILSPSGWETEDGVCEGFLEAAALSANRSIDFGADAVNCVVDGVGFTYAPGTPASFQVFGNLNFRGFDMSFAGDVGYVASSRSDTGAFQQFASLSLESEAVGETVVGGNFLSRGDFAAGGPRFPDNVLTIVAEQDVALASNKNPTIVTAPIYAGAQARISSQTQLFGQIIADVFCTMPPGNTDDCGIAGSPTNIVFVPSGENRPRSYRAIAPTGGLPTFRVESYELR